ncbi:amino acid aminotransferase [uncultured Planktomarina sp.]|uniref:amino acid aminotransferase n=1 Tax=uncultured Planktomarina sp. TaxID=1538529 RepID=UPI0032609AA4|tara:strand:- start:2886 stop:4070 length:1185 start_codon:yes stop_codon:yes gene_type:complete
MLSNLTAQPQDKILALMGAYRADPRLDKIDLGVGVYKDATGTTPIMRAIKSAEQLLWQVQETKSYVGLAGDPAFSAAMYDLVLDGAVSADRLSAVATPGGTGAVRQALELIKIASPKTTVWLSNPTWPNHPSIVKYLGMTLAEYRYFDAENGAVDFDGMLADIKAIPAGDVVLLHGCCHNPTGANLTSEQEDQIIAALATSGAIPFVDIAYQGFGDGLDEDARFTRKIASQLPECLIAASCSKNFGIYRERTGILMAISPSASLQAVTQDNMAFLNRQNFSFPPDHGARLVTMILGDDSLRSTWATELEQTRLGMLGLRQHLSDELRQRTNSDRFDFLATHRGMFSRLGVSAEAVETIRTDFGIYMIGDSRINIAGLNAQTVPILANALAQITK